MTNCVIAGVGGQGTVLASRLIGMAALAKGFDVRGSETIGMAQRGGSVTSHVRMGRNIQSPLIPPGKADIAIAFEPGEAVRALPFLSPEGAMVVCDRAVQPSVGAYEAEPLINYLRENVKRLYIADGDGLISLCGARCLNVALIGLALKTGALPFTQEDMEKALTDRLPARYLEMNLAALRTGMRQA